MDRGGLRRHMSVGIARCVWIAAFIIGLCAWESFLLAQTQMTTRRSSKSSAKTTSESRVETIEQKAHEILTTQQQILQKLDALLEELRIVKIRVSR